MIAYLSSMNGGSSAYVKHEYSMKPDKELEVPRHLVSNHEEAFTRSALADATRLERSDVDDQLESLVQMGWIREHNNIPFYPSTYRINLQNEDLRALLEEKSRAIETPRNRRQNREHWAISLSQELRH